MKKTTEQAIRDKILYIGNEIPESLMSDKRSKFIVLGTPQEFIDETSKKKYPKLIGAIHLIALLGSKKYQICEKEEAEYFVNVKFWDKDDEELRGDFQVFINLTPISR